MRIFEETRQNSDERLELGIARDSSAIEVDDVASQCQGLAVRFALLAALLALRLHARDLFGVLRDKIHVAANKVESVGEQSFEYHRGRHRRTEPEEELRQL